MERRAWLAAGTVAAAVGLMGLGTAFACTGNYIVVTPTVTTAGSLITVRGGNYDPAGGAIHIYWNWDGGPMVGTASVSEAGTFSQQVRIPSIEGLQGNVIVKAVQLRSDGSAAEPQPSQGMAIVEIRAEGVPRVSASDPAPVSASPVVPLAAADSATSVEPAPPLGAGHASTAITPAPARPPTRRADPPTPAVVRPAALPVPLSTTQMASDVGITAPATDRLVSGPSPLNVEATQLVIKEPAQAAKVRSTRGAAGSETAVVVAFATVLVGGFFLGVVSVRRRRARRATSPVAPATRSLPTEVALKSSIESVASASVAVKSPEDVREMEMAR